jgi:Replication-relaxation
MPRGTNLTLTNQTALGLFFIQRYSFLTIDQFARITALNRSTASGQLRCMERLEFLGHFGNTGLAPGSGKTPKVYFLTRKGWELLSQESDIPPDLIGNHKEIHIHAKWSPQMYHRLHTVDLMISAEVAVHNRPQLTMVKTFLEYRRIKRDNHIAKETTDYVAEDKEPATRIVPDAAFIIENIDTKKRALFFLEMDMATERIVSFITREKQITIHHKIAQYDRYLQSFRYTQTYADYGDFRHFTLLFVTLTDKRIEHIREEMADLPAELAQYYRLTTYARAMGDFLGPIWLSRTPSDSQLYPLVRQHSIPEAV